MDKKVEEKLKRVLKGLEKEGFKVREIPDAKQTINFLGETNLLAGRENYSINFNKGGKIKFETSWSNQQITQEWLDKTHRIFNLLRIYNLGGF